jgi:hypothetical protein
MAVFADRFSSGFNVTLASRAGAFVSAQTT